MRAHATLTAAAALLLTATTLPAHHAAAAATPPAAAPAATPPAAAPAATPPAAAPAVARVEDARRDAHAPWTSGIPIARATTRPTGLGFWCTAGLPALTRSGRPVILTAGHCGRMDETITTAWTRGHRRIIGTVTGTSRTIDVAVIATRGPVAARSWTGPTSSAPLRGVATVRPGQQVCHDGYRSGRVCGITVVDNRILNGVVVEVYGRVSPGRLAARGGDSGGLATDTAGHAVGIVSAISPDGRWIGWTPARTALNTWGLRPITSQH